MKYYPLIITILLISVAGCFNRDPGDKGRYEQNYDDFIKSYQPKYGGWEHYNDSHVVYITDKIYQHEYNETWDKTKIWLESRPGGRPVYISKSITKAPDNGNLKVYYSRGDVIDFELHVVSVDNTHQESILEWYL